MKKKVLALLLAVCLLALCLPVTAGAAQIDTLDGFLNRTVNNGLFIPYDCEAIGPEEGDTISFFDAVARVYSLPTAADPVDYGMKVTYSGTALANKTLPLADAKWLYTNIFNWSEDTWQAMLDYAKGNKGYLDKTQKYACIKNNRLYCFEGARGSSGPSVEIVEQRSKGARIEVVFNCVKQSAQGAPQRREQCFAEVERKTISGKGYWTLYRARKLEAGENPFTPQRPTVGGFSDVFEGEYYADPVKWAVENNITQGETSTSFAPNKTCTRGQIVTFLWRANGEPEPASTVNPFVDVKAGEYYYKAMLWAKEKGITSGTDDTHFSPNAACSRAQAVTFLWRANNEPAGSGGGFSDVKNGEFYTDAVKWAVQNGITNGETATTFAPNKSCTRGQIVTFLYRDKT